MMIMIMIIIITTTISICFTLPCVLQITDTQSTSWQHTIFSFYEALIADICAAL